MTSLIKYSEVNLQMTFERHLYIAHTFVHSSLRTLLDRGDSNSLATHIYIESILITTKYKYYLL